MSAEQTTGAGREADEVRLAEIRARAEAATAGPWDACGEGAEDKWPEGACACGAVYGAGMTTFVLKAYDLSDHRELQDDGLPTPAARAANALFAAHAREDVPYLLARLSRLEARYDVLQAAAEAWVIVIANPAQVADFEAIAETERNLALALGDLHSALKAGDGVNE